MPDALLLSGGGPYADRWHDFAATTARIAALIEDCGYSVAITDDVEAGLRRPGVCRLLVANFGNPIPPRPAWDLESVQAGLEDHLAAGGALLALHATITSMTTMPAWRGILGGFWVRGRSMHPPRGTATIMRTDAEHPITAGLGDFVVVDERYSFLDAEPGLQVLYAHDHDDRRHPLIWAREVSGHRVVYDALGHDTASFDSPGHQALLRSSVHWLLA
jgi:uncharacterized protein